jgi:hypothetical protein
MLFRRENGTLGIECTQKDAPMRSRRDHDEDCCFHPM